MTVLHRNRAGGRTLTLTTEVYKMEAGRVIILLDSSADIELGDSGGGVFNSQGELIGNVWSFVVFDDGSRGIAVDLLPPDIEEHIE